MWRIDSPTSWDAAGARVQRVGFPSNSNICHFEWIQISNNLCLYSPSGNMWCQLCLQYFKGFIKSAGNTPCLQALNFMAKELRNRTLFFFFSPFLSPFSCQLAFKTTGSDFRKAYGCAAMLLIPTIEFTGKHLYPPTQSYTYTRIHCQVPLCSLIQTPFKLLLLSKRGTVQNL